MDYPRGYVIRLSEDRQSWYDVARKDNNTSPVDAFFAPQRTRYSFSDNDFESGIILRLVQS